MLILKQSTASQAVLLGPFVDSTDGVTAETGLTIANTDIRLSANGGNMAAKNSGGGTHDENGWYTITLDATDTATVGRLQVSCVVSGALPVFMEFQVVEESTYDFLYASGSDPDADVAAILADTNELQSDDIPGAIAGLNDPTAAAIADAVWDETVTGHDDAGKAGAQLWTDIDAILTDTAEIGAAGAGLTEAGGDGDHLTEAGGDGDHLTEAGGTGDQLTALATASALSTVDSNVDAILVDTGTTLPATLSGLATASALATVDSNVDAILVDTGTTIPGTITTIDTVVDAIKAKTDSLTFTVSGQVDANLQYVNDVAVTGDGGLGTEWGPA